MASISHILVSAEGTGKPVDHYTTATQDLTLANPNVDTGSGADLFGNAVSVSGTKMVVGAPYEDAGAVVNTGKAYYYNGSTTPTFVFDNPSNGTPDYFGSAVDVDGPRVIIGAHGVDDPATDSGKVYVYNIQGYFPTTPDAVLTNPSDHNNSPNDDKFGYSVAISEHYMVVGAPYEDAGTSTDGGTAYVYSTLSNNKIQTLNQPTPGNNELFGWSVDTDDRYALVGAPGRTASAGAAFLYIADSGVLVHTFNNPDYDGGDQIDNFGTSVAISGKYVIVGAPNEDTTSTTSEHTGVAYVYDLTSVTPLIPILTLINPDQTLATGQDNIFGQTVDIDGIHAIVGAPGTGANAGAAYIFDITGGSPLAPVETITNPTANAGEFFGNSVSISGAIAAVGADTADVVYTYDLS